MPIKVYAMPFQHNYHSILLACKMANVEYELCFTSIMAGENKTPEFLAKFPMHSLPCLEDTDNGLCINETNAILRYICNKSNFHKGYPADAKMRAICDATLDHKLCCIGTNLAKELIYPTAGFAAPADKEKEMVYIAKMKAEEWPAIMQYIKANGGKFVCGNDVTIADISFWSFVNIVFCIWPACPIFTEVDGLKQWYEDVKAALPAGVITEEHTSFWAARQHA